MMHTPFQALQKIVRQKMPASICDTGVAKSYWILLYVTIQSYKASCQEKVDLFVSHISIKYSPVGIPYFFTELRYLVADHFIHRHGIRLLRFPHMLHFFVSVNIDSVVSSRFAREKVSRKLS